MIQTGFHVSRPTQVADLCDLLASTGVSPSMPQFSNCFLFAPRTPCRLLQPRLARKQDGLGSVPFDRHYSGYRFFLPLPAGTKMFQFPAFAPAIRRYMVFNHVGSPIRTSADQVLFANPRGFSQLTTSFLATRSQGILRSLFFSFSFVNLSRLIAVFPDSASLKFL